MDRRQFLYSAASAALLARSHVTSASQGYPEIAFTFDDPTTEGAANLESGEVNERILAALARHGLKSALFVCGMRVDSERGHELVAAWDRQAHLICNHSYSHLFFDRVSLSEFENDARRNEPLIRSYRHFARLFRYPYFKEGDSAAKRDGMREFLRKNGYRTGRATIDASDWAISARLEKRVKSNPTAGLSGYRDYFLAHIWERAQFYNSLSQRLLNRGVRHTVLLHYNVLNALFLDDLIRLFAARGWRPVDAEYAYADPVYDRQPHILPAGESLVWALAKEHGGFESELRYPGEDDIYENPKMDAAGL